MIITLDGPAASGKSTVAQMLARDLDIMYLNTGLLYRAFAYCLINDRLCTQEMLANPRDQDIDFVKKSGLIRYDYDSQKGALLLYREENIAHLLKAAHVDHWASVVSAHPGVRQALLSMQRDLGKQRDLVVEGRDCGTVVFPHADFKFFMTASLETRAMRWCNDQKTRNSTVSYDEACVILQQRDARDSTRAVAPLKVPANSYMIDTTAMDLADVVARIKAIISKI